MMHTEPQDSRDDWGPLDERLDEALKERFRPPATKDILKAAGVASGGPIDGSESAPAGSPAGWPVPLFLLAAAAALVLGTFLYRSNKRETPAPKDERVTEWVSTYDELNDGGPAPVCSCDPQCESFREHCVNMFAQALDFPADAAVELLGESCCDETEGSVSLAARCDGETVCLFVLLREAAPIIHEKLRRGLSIHRRDFGALSAFELSSRPEPKILPHLVVN